MCAVCYVCAVCKQLNFVLLFSTFLQAIQSTTGAKPKAWKKSFRFHFVSEFCEASVDQKTDQEKLATVCTGDESKRFLEKKYLGTYKQPFV